MTSKQLLETLENSTVQTAAAGLVNAILALGIGLGAIPAEAAPALFGALSGTAFLIAAVLRTHESGNDQ